MARCYQCPFYKWNTAEVIYCEGGKISMGDKESQSSFVKKFCADAEGFRQCSIAQTLS